MSDIDKLRGILKDLNITDDNVERTLSEIQSIIISKDDEIIQNKNRHEETIKEYKNTISELKNNKDIDSKELQLQVDKLNNNIKEMTKKHEDEILTTKKDNAINLELTKEQCKNNKMAITSIDYDKISIDNNGKIIGLTEQIKQLKSENDFLFNQTNDVPVETKEETNKLYAGTTPYNGDTATEINNNEVVLNGGYSVPSFNSFVKQNNL